MCNLRPRPLAINEFSKIEIEIFKNWNWNFQKLKSAYQFHDECYFFRSLKCWWWVGIASDVLVSAIVFLFICDRMWIPERDKVPVSPMSFHSYVSLSHHLIGTQGLLVFRAELVTRSSVDCIPPAAKVPETGVSVTLTNQSQNSVPSSHSSFRIRCPKDVQTEMKVNFNQFPNRFYTLWIEARFCLSRPSYISTDG